jgi:hypothetical protein
MFQVTKTFILKNGNSSEFVWEMLLARRETYLPLLSQEISTLEGLLSEVKTMSMQLASSGKLLTKFTEVSVNTQTLIFKMNFLDQDSWNEYVNVMKSTLGYDPSVAIDIADSVTEMLTFDDTLVPNELTVYNPTL